MAAQLPLPQLSGRLPVAPQSQLQATGDTDDNNIYLNISSVSAATQEQRDVRLLISLFMKK